MSTRRASEYTPAVLTGAREDQLSHRASVAAAFAAAGVVSALANATAPFTRGWWLVAYLILVGCLSQLLLGEGQLSHAARVHGRAPSAVRMRWQLALWNLGALIVAVAEMASEPGLVLAGSLLLLLSLALFAVACSWIARTATHRARRWERYYLLLVMFLAVSVLTGCGLAGALPGQ
ncbi:MAG: hypothetical protein ACRDK2_00660 [Solirubrobacteraceae bacterium]